MVRITSKALASFALAGLVAGLVSTGTSSIHAATPIANATAYTFVAECPPMKYTSCRTNKKCNVPIHGWLPYDDSIWKRSPQDTPNPCGSSDESVDEDRECNHTKAVKECDDSDGEG